jgi:amino acid adenylation domain-containing protein
VTTSLNERIAQLGPAQRELLERRLDAPPAVEVPLTPSSSGSAVPVSPTQKSMWFVHHLDPAAPVFNNTHALRIRGPLDVAALEQALTDLVRRHEILRTNYQLVDGELMQFVGSPPDSVLEVRDAPGYSGDFSGDLRRTLEVEGSRPFDLEHDVLYRAVLHRLADDDHILTRTTHHIAFDRWSAAIANREINELYAARLTGRHPDLPELGIQYADYARWQLENLSADTTEARLRFFTSHIAGAPDSLELPADHPRTRPHGAAATLARQIPAELAARLRVVGRELGATPFMVLLASFGLLMGRYTRSDQMLVGIPVASRSRPELTDLIGPFINTVVLRLDLRGEPSFKELVERVRRTSLNMIAHQDLPFDELVRAVAPDRVASRTPLFSMMFDYLNTPHAKLALENTDIEPVQLDAGTAAHDLILFIEDQPTGISGRWEYRADLFDRATIGGLAGAYDTMVERLVTDPEARIEDIGMLDAAGEQRVRSISSGPTHPTTSNIFAAIEDMRSLTPGTVAVAGGGKTYTYDQLAVAARQIAAGLQEAGVQPGDAVALLIDRSVDLVASFLGVMMVGGAALLLDRDQPHPRLSEMLRTAAPSVVLSNDTGDGLKADEFRFVTVESLSFGDGPETATMTPHVSLGANDPAYVVFTSGSTGAPKGVVVGHGSLDNFVAAAVSLYDLGPADRILQFASPGFDTFVEEVLPALSVGATVVMRPEELFASFTAFERFVEDEAITVLDLPTAWWHSWVADMTGSGRRPPSTLRLVIVGGEPAMADIWRDWTRLAGDVRWINSYGPSEGTVVVSTFEPTADYRPTSRVMPLGRPIPNTSLLVVDPAGQPTPPRVPGEIRIEGDAVALGYVGADGDQSGFVTDEALGRRGYRTGDLARQLPDGTLEFLGRLDSQVKVRGTRVEPAEVEAALRKLPDIVEAVVVTDRESHSGLVGHVVVRSGLDPSLIRQQLAERLPEPMIPGKWRVHGAIPLTPGGKHDRLLLEALEVERATAQDGGIVGPRSESEAKLLEIWEAVLGRSDISMTDSFFDLGGHSLLGVKMISRISSVHGVELPLRAIFETPTIESMAKVLETAHA